MSFFTKVVMMRNAIITFIRNIVAITKNILTGLI